MEYVVNADSTKDELSTKRTEFEGSNLNISFITDRILIMANPYHNDQLANVRKFFEVKLEGKYRIYNLSDEDEFNIEQDLEHVYNLPFQEGTICPLEKLIPSLVSIDSYLMQNIDSYIIFHSKGGTGRCGLVTSCLLLHLGIVRTAMDAVQMTLSGRGSSSLTIPSQIRYVFYYEMLLRIDRLPLQSFKLHTIRLNTIPRCSASIVSAGSSPSISIFSWAKDDDGNWISKLIYNQTDDSNPVNVTKKLKNGVDRHAEVNLTENNILMRGDICIVVHSEGEKIGQLFFNTSFVEKNYLCFEKFQIDVANMDKYHRVYDKDFSIEILIEKIIDNQALSIISFQDQQHIAHELHNDPFIFNSKCTAIQDE